MEIERKFLIKYMPEGLENYARKEIEQGYLNRRPVLRIRKSNDEYILTYKSKPVKNRDASGTFSENGDVICNNEIEAPLTEEAYYHLREKVDGNLIVKTRYLIPIGTCRENCPGASETIEKDGAYPDAEIRLTIELDVFHGKLEDLVFAEVEFPSVDAAEHFVKPEWFGEDVSSDPRYRNGHLTELEDLAEFENTANGRD